MEWTIRDVAWAVGVLFACGIFFAQMRATNKSVEIHESRLREVERVANDTALLLKRSSDTLDRVTSRLDEHERDGAMIEERVNNHGIEIGRLRDERCT